MTWADRILRASRALDASGWKLPRGVRALNPFEGEEATQVMPMVRAFYRKFYADDAPRRLILGINPGRLGAGATGVPFTDTKRMEQVCGIPAGGLSTHEPSSVFVYRVVRAFGGPEAFYGQFLIHSVCPLGFVRKNAAGREVNCNYYDDKKLQAAMTPGISAWLRKLASWPVNRERVFCLGSGKNFEFLARWNEEHQQFGAVVPLDHPRFVMQYRAKKSAAYVRKYRRLLTVRE